MQTLDIDELLSENAALRRRLEETESALRAVGMADIDTILVNALEEIDQPYRLLVNQIPQAAAILTVEGILVYCNSRFVELMQRPLRSLLGESMELLIADGQPWPILLRNRQGEVSLRRGDGSMAAVYLGLSPLEEGALGSCLLVTDQTEHRRYEELLKTQAALRASEDRYRVLFDSIDEGFCVIELLFDDAGRAVDYLFWETNPSFEQQTGWREVVGKTVRQLIPQLEEHWFQTFGHVAMTGAPIRFQNLAAGLQRWYDVYAFRVGEPHERKVAVLFNDITARRRSEEQIRISEERLRAILDSTPAVAYMVDREQRFTFINRRWKALFNLTNEETSGRSVFDFFPKHVADQFVANNRHVLADGKPIECEEVVSQADGEHTYISSKVPLLDAAGQPYAICGISIDITERKQAVQALQEADRMKDEFLATLAHELRNPLAPMRNAVQILQSQGPPVPELVWARGVIDRQLQLMSRLLEDLLDVSRISRNRLELRKERVELRTVVESAIETSRPVVEAGHHQLTIQLPEKPIWLEVDAVRMAQVFANLLTNAGKYTTEGGRIGLVAEQQGQEVVVSVQDSGIGISSEMLPHIFEIFSQAEPALERSQGGLGIGLSLVKGLVELHQGRIEARSAGLGRGSEFVVHLPIANTVVEREHVRSVKTDRPQPTVRRRILIADDVADNADSLAMLLKVLGHEVITAYDGRQAVEAVEARRPEVVLLDLGMPKLNGYEVCQHIRRQSWGADIYLIALTGWSQEEDRRRTQEAGFDHHMIKPVDPRELSQLLGSLPMAKNA